MNHNEIIATVSIVYELARDELAYAPGSVWGSGMVSRGRRLRPANADSRGSLVRFNELPTSQSKSKTRPINAPPHEQLHRIAQRRLDSSIHERRSAIVG